MTCENGITYLRRLEDRDFTYPDPARSGKGAAGVRALL